MSSFMSFQNVSYAFTLKEWTCTTGQPLLASCSEVILFPDVVFTVLSAAPGSGLAL